MNLARSFHHTAVASLLAVSIFTIACAPQPKSAPLHSQPPEAGSTSGTSATPAAEKTPTLAERKAATKSFSPQAPVLPPAICRDADSLATSFDELSLAYDGEGEFDRNYLTETAAGLIGKPVCVRGYVLAAGFRGQQSSSFVLVRHNGKCCFGQGAPPSDNIQVTMDPGGLVSLTDKPIQVEGILTLRPWTGPDDLVWSIYHLQASSAKP